MRILEINSKSIDFIATELKRYGRVFSVDTEPDWSVHYDCIIGKIDDTLWSVCENHATTVVLESPSAALTERLSKEYTTMQKGRILSVLLSFGKNLTNIDLELRYSCVHRSFEPVRLAGCAPCQALTGKPQVPIFRCRLFDCECSVASREIAGKGKVNLDTGKQSPRAVPCTTCKDRVPIDTKSQR